MQKKNSESCFLAFFDFETLNVLDFADYDTNDCCSSYMTGNDRSLCNDETQDLMKRRSLCQKLFRW